MTKLEALIRANTILTLAAIFFIYHVVATVVGMVSFGYLLWSPGEQIQVESSQDKNGPTTSIDERMNQVVYGTSTTSDQWPKRIIITPAAINIGIVGHAYQDQWQVDDKRVTYASDTALPNGLAGNTVLFGRTEDGPFEGLVNIKTNHEILIKTAQADYTYTVVGFSTQAGSVEDARLQTADPTLTLIAAPSWQSEQKLVITASMSRVDKK